MKHYYCEKCNRNQTGGKFCLDCGQKLTEIVTNQISFKPIKSSRTADQLKRDVRVWLNRVGVQNSDIQIRTSNIEVEIDYTIGLSRFSFKSNLQNTLTNNLAAVEQFLHSRVLGIERGIETIEQAFAGYEQLPDYSNNQDIDPYIALGFQDRVDVETAKKKFKILIKKFHPDINDSLEASKQFQSLKRAMDKIEEGY